jgi:phosphinothricin acetyltransferase
MSETAIRSAVAADAAAICAIYNPYVASTTISFEEAPVAAADMAQRIADVGAAGLP